MSDWYYAADNAQKGPVNEAELKGFLASNKIPGDTLVWKDGMGDWTPANQVPAFSFRAAPEPAKATPAAAATTTSEPSTTPNPESAKPIDLTKLMGKGETLEVDDADVETNRVFGILAYLGPLCLVPIIVAKDSPFAKYHANQGLILFVAEIAAFVITFCGLLIPFIGMLFYALHVISYLVFGVFMIIGIINAAGGKCVPLPVIGGVKLIK